MRPHQTGWQRPFCRMVDAEKVALTYINYYDKIHAQRSSCNTLESNFGFKLFKIIFHVLGLSKS